MSTVWYFPLVYIKGNHLLSKTDLGNLMNVAVVLVYRLFPAAHMYLGDGHHKRY